MAGRAYPACMKTIALALGLTFAAPSALAACAAVSPSATPSSAPDTAPETAASSSSASAPATAPAAAEPTALQQRPLDLTNDCAHEMHVYFGEHPGDGKGEAKTLAPGAAVAVPRRPGGAVVVWVTDDKGFGLASVHVTKRMRRVRIDASCMKIDADTSR
jgi:hypothetical protein